jgi:hypothetical protein
MPEVRIFFHFVITGQAVRKFIFLVIGGLAVTLTGSVSLVYAVVDDIPAVLAAEQPTPQSLTLAKDTLKTNQSGVTATRWWKIDQNRSGQIDGE